MPKVGDDGWAPTVNEERVRGPPGIGTEGERGTSGAGLVGLLCTSMAQEGRGSAGRGLGPTRIGLGKGTRGFIIFILL